MRCARVSVILPTYNRGIYFCHAIKSVFAQPRTALELPAVDDRSTDGTG